VRVVLDTNVLLSGLMYPSSTPGRIVSAWRQSRFELVMSREQLAEIARVLTYPRIHRILRWNRDRIERFLKQIYLRSVVVGIEETEIEVPTDSDDSPTLQSFIAAQADWLVTGDKDLLLLRDEHAIMTPAEFADLL